MNMNLLYYKTIWLILVIAFLWSVGSWALSYLWDYSLAQGIGPLLVVMGCLSIYDRYLWKMAVFNWLVTIPNLNGQYKGCIEHNLNGCTETKNCELRIQQTCSHITVTAFFSKEGENSTRSESKEALITRDSHGNHELVFYYANEGSNVAGDNLQEHSGVCRLRVEIKPDSIELSGFYFTSRLTKGKIMVEKNRDSA